MIPQVARSGQARIAEAGTAPAIADALGGRRCGPGWMGRCPAHDDRAPSLSIKAGDDGKVLVHCHAGCHQRDVIAALRARGLWDELGQRRGAVRMQPRTAASRQQRQPDEVERTAAAMRLWNSATCASGTLVETYLRHRGLQMAIPDVLRFRAVLRHPTGVDAPAMLALVTRGTDDKPIAIHRTFLASDGRGKSPADPQKMMLGPCRGGAVRLAPLGGVLMVGEGIETVLAAMQATGLAGWAALSTSGLRTLDLPGDVCDVIVLADGDDPGEAAARDASIRWKREGRRVRIARAPRGLDFNDVLLGHGRADRVVEVCR